MDKITFYECPFCGKDPEILQQMAGEDNYCICSCKDESCKGYNRKTFDSVTACAGWWNNLLISDDILNEPGEAGNERE